MTPATAVPVSVLIVTWNSAEVLPACLEALAASDPPPAELVVVDNASSDGSVAIVEDAQRTLPFKVSLLRRVVNTGFAAGMNAAIALSSSPFVFLLNPDARVTPEALTRLLDAMSHGDRTYAVGPKLLRADGPRLAATRTIDSTGIAMTRDGRHVDRGAGDEDDGRWDAPGQVFGISGAAVLFRRSALDAARIDGQVFDEDFFAYREDADLAWRMRGFGYEARYEPGATVYHQRRVTPERRRSLPPEINYHSVKNRFLLRIHHADPAWLAAFGLTSYLRDLVVLGACLTIERSSLPALIWIARRLPRHLRRRREILARRKVSSRQLRSWFA